MSSYSKKYISIKDESQSVFLTWETGYKNLKVYYEGVLIQTIETPWKLTNGVSFEHPELGNVELHLTTSSPMIIELKIGGIKYFAESMKANMKKEAFSGLVSVFWTLSVLSLISALLVQINYGYRLDVPVVLIQLIFDIVIISIYVISAIFLSRRKIWAYYLGAITFLAMTLLYVYSGFILSGNVSTIIVVVVRIAILIYIIRCYKDVMMAKSTTEFENHEILDNNKNTDLEF